MPKLPKLEIHGRYPDDPAIILRLSDFAGVVNGCSFGRIFMIKSNFDHHGDLYYLRLYDTDTGFPMLCPDARCKNSRGYHMIENIGNPDDNMRAVNLTKAKAWPPVGDGCAICTITGDRARFSKYTEDDIAFFRKEGMIRGE